jgi:hypothetical protein
VPEFSGLLRSDIERLHESALKAQHGEEALAELRDLETGIKIASDTIEAAREEVANEVGGIAKLNAASAPYEKLQSAAWLKKFMTDGVEEVRSFHVTGNRGYWNPASEEELENGMYFKTADEWRMAQSGIVPHQMKEHGNGQF